MITTFRGDFWRQASIKQTHFYTQTFYKKTAVVDALIWEARAEILLFTFWVMEFQKKTAVEIYWPLLY